jgi:hypothetical protein
MREIGGAQRTHSKRLPCLCARVRLRPCGSVRMSVCVTESAHACAHVCMRIYIQTHLHGVQRNPKGLAHGSDGAVVGARDALLRHFGRRGQVQLRETRAWRDAMQNADPAAHNRPCLRAHAPPARPAHPELGQRRSHAPPLAGQPRVRVNAPASACHPPRRTQTGGRCRHQGCWLGHPRTHPRCAEARSARIRGAPR